MALLIDQEILNKLDDSWVTPYLIELPPREKQVTTDPQMCDSNFPPMHEKQDLPMIYYLLALQDFYLC